MTEDDVLAALGTVYDPELDEPITELRFVTSCEVADSGAVAVRLRLPTPQCAPNFAYLMAADARNAVLGVPGVGAVSVVLEDHYTGDGDQRGRGRGGGFEDRSRARPPGTRRAAHAVPAQGARRAPVAAARRPVGGPIPVSARLGELSGPDADRCRELRRELGIDAPDDAPAFVPGDGTPVGADAGRASLAWRR